MANRFKQPEPITAAKKLQDDLEKFTALVAEHDRENGIEFDLELNRTVDKLTEELEYLIERVTVFHINPFHGR